MEGIAVLSIVLKANGYAPFLLKKNEKGDYVQIYEKPEDENKPKFAFLGRKMQKKVSLYVKYITMNLMNCLKF